MQALITVEKAREVAFSRQEYLPDDQLTPLRIQIAQDRYVRPVVGEELYEALEQGLYANLLDEFIAPVIAFGVRVMWLAQLRMKVATGGVLEATGGEWQAISEEGFQAALRSLRCQFEALRGRLDRELQRLYDLGQLPEWRPSMNIRNRCRTYGGLVQSR